MTCPRAQSGVLAQEEGGGKGASLAYCAPWTMKSRASGKIFCHQPAMAAGREALAEAKQSCVSDPSLPPTSVWSSFPPHSQPSESAAQRMCPGAKPRTFTVGVGVSSAETHQAVPELCQQLVPRAERLEFLQAQSRGDKGPGKAEVLGTWPGVPGQAGRTMPYSL